MRRDVFQAIADPTRRAIIDILAGQSLNLNAVAENFDISRPAISKHIKILTECGLISNKTTRQGAVLRSQSSPLREVSKWVKQYKVFWTKKLDALEISWTRTTMHLKKFQEKIFVQPILLKTQKIKCMPSSAPFVIERTLNAPVEKVWQCHYRQRTNETMVF